MSGVRFVNTESPNRIPTWHRPEPLELAVRRAAKLRVVYAAVGGPKSWDGRRYGPGELRLLALL